MNILVTGAKGFIGKNLCATLKNIRDGKDRTRPALSVDKVFEYDMDTAPALLETFCAEVDFVFHLAGINRTSRPKEFLEGNVGFTRTLLEILKHQGNPCPVMLASSIQASCTGRFDNDYGRSKKASESLVFSYAAETGARVLVYRLPHVFGKWCQPEHNSAVATFCYRSAHELPIQVHDRATQLELLYIDDLVAELLDAMAGNAHTFIMDDVSYCIVPTTHTAALGEIVDLLNTFKAQPNTLVMPEIPPASFAKKLFATYLSYLPEEKIAIPLRTHTDPRGSFTELLKTEACGQVSVNVVKPGTTKGEHWHHTKWELCVVVSGRGVVQQRRIGSEEVLRFPVNGEKPEAVQLLPGYTHKIVNCSETENLVAILWASEPYDAAWPDTFSEAVE